jgi:hypothetical protein
VYLNTEIMTDPRTAELGGTMWFYVRGACYVCLHNTRRIPKTEIDAWRPDYPNYDLDAAIATLVDAGLWADMGDGYHVPDLGLFMSDTEGNALGIME